MKLAKPKECDYRDLACIVLVPEAVEWHGSDLGSVFSKCVRWREMWCHFNLVIEVLRHKTMLYVLTQVNGGI